MTKELKLECYSYTLKWIFLLFFVLWGICASLRMSLMPSVQVQFQPDYLGDHTQSSLHSPQIDANQSLTTHLCTVSQRTQHLQDMCDTETAPFPHGGTRLIVDDKRKLMMCEISKSGCTTMKALWLHSNMNEGKNLSNIPMKHTGMVVHNGGFTARYRMKLVTSYSVNITKYNGYTKFLAVRNPFDRLVSAYYYVVNGHLSHYADRLKKRYENLKNNESNLSFEQFIEFVTDPKERYYNDRHIAPYSQTCQPCNIHYDYVIRLESFSTYPENDSLPILQMLGYEPSYLRLKEAQQNSRNRPDEQIHPSPYSKKLPLYESLTFNLFKKILERYRLDLKLFGYDFDIKSMVASCYISTGEDTCC